MRIKGKLDLSNTVLKDSDIFWDDFTPKAREYYDQVALKLFDKKAIKEARRDPEIREIWDHSLLSDFAFRLMGNSTGKRTKTGFDLGSKNEISIPIEEEIPLKLRHNEEYLNQEDFSKDWRGFSEKEARSHAGQALSIKPKNMDNTIMIAVGLAALRNFNSTAILKYSNMGTGSGNRKPTTKYSDDENIENMLNILEMETSGVSARNGLQTAGITTNLEHVFPSEHFPQYNNQQWNKFIGPEHLNKAYKAYLGSNIENAVSTNTEKLVRMAMLNDISL